MIVIDNNPELLATLERLVKIHSERRAKSFNKRLKRFLKRVCG